MLEGLSEGHLIDDAVGGDPRAVQRLLRLHWRRIEGFVREHLPQSLCGLYEPRDILQDVYQLAFRSISSFKPDGTDAAFRWFVTIARNRMAELLRAHMTAKRGGGREAVGMDDLGPLLEKLAISYRTPSQSAIRRELVVDLEQAIEVLPPDYQEAIRLRYFAGLGFEEIAQRMNRSRGSAQMLCNRALKRLKLDLVSASRYA